jgi:TPR repeat protein
MKRHLLLLATLALPALAAAGPATSFADAAKRHRAGDTAAAMAFWVPLAQQGDANAAFNLAVIHQHGDGVAKNPAEALKWYRIAAERATAPRSRAWAPCTSPAKARRRTRRRAGAGSTSTAWPTCTTTTIRTWSPGAQQAAELIDERDRREAFAASRRSSAQVMADLKRRSGSPAAVQLAAGREAPATTEAVTPARGVPENSRDAAQTTSLYITR